MSNSDEVTTKEGPVEKLLAAGFDRLDRRLEGAEDRIAAKVVNAAMPRINKVEISQRTLEHKFSEQAAELRAIKRELAQVTNRADEIHALSIALQERIAQLEMRAARSSESDAGS